MSMLTRFAAIAALSAGLSGLAVPATAADRAFAPAPVQVAAGSEHDGYIDRAQREMREWKKKVAAFGRDVKREGKEMKEGAARKLDAAWDEVEENWKELKQASKEAGNESWRKAREAYEASRDKLQQAWEDATS